MDAKTEKAIREVNIEKNGLKEAIDRIEETINDRIL